MEGTFIEWDYHTVFIADEDGVAVSQVNPKTKQRDEVYFMTDSENNVYDTIDNVILYLQALKKKLHAEENK